MQKSAYIIRATVVLIILLTGFAVLGSHIYNLQIARHDELLAKARSKYTSSQTQEGERGLIYDSRGNLLAGNLACKNVLAEPRRFGEERMRISRILSNVLGMKQRKLLEKFNTEQIEIPIKRGVDIETAESIAELDLPGIRLVDSTRRYYPKGMLASNLLGILNSKGNGVSGIEAKMDTVLKPTTARKIFERDRQGHELKNIGTEDSIAHDGGDVYLTIDEPIQSIMEDELDRMVQEFQPSAAYAVMADPETGALLGVAQYPTFNPNIRSAEDMAGGQWQNHFLTKGFEPGSIMKSISIAGALDYDAVEMGTVINCENGSWYYGGAMLHDAGHSYGNLRVWQVLQKSSNIGTAKIGLQLGEGRLYQILRRFGFGRPTGLSPSEASGILRPLDRWDGLSVTRFPIGQGLLATPAQIIQAYNALANQGVMMELRLIDHIDFPYREKKVYNKPRVKRRAVRPKTARQIVAALKQVPTEEGTAEEAAIEGYKVAGKTGTSQKFIDGTYKSDKYVASFVGFVPADDPAFVLLVVADEPSRGGIYGGTVAAPTFRRISERTLRYLQVPPNNKQNGKMIKYTKDDKGVKNDGSETTAELLLGRAG